MTFRVLLLVFFHCMPYLLGVLLGLTLRFGLLDSAYFWWYVAACVVVSVPPTLWAMRPPGTNPNRLS